MANFKNLIDCKVHSGDGYDGYYYVHGGYGQ